MSLYELTAERLALQRRLEGMELDAETIADTLEGESSALEAKVEDYCYIIQNLQATADATLAEMERISELYQRRDKKVKNVREWLLKNLVACSISKMDLTAFSVSVRNNPERLIVDNEALIARELFKVPEPSAPRPDNAVIKALLKAGQPVPGAHLERSQRLEIK